ncbi:hypothetical protein Phum_PHUM546080 [Pediculus humanus corporis]|uniref:Uncharacterized protein n=1 Tax=Pediculus humanus subsp. corporis TaxID=121224 RepID=E0W061_PEDHC|nr:uncharacterized protein Phum_PHUM546080 [Pediculus humanus corporis]EEB19017.1 hypothetical protein Phum_PHUM546080 [Pediculus humanus corporis]
MEGKFKALEDRIIGLKPFVENEKKYLSDAEAMMASATADDENLASNEEDSGVKQQLMNLENEKLQLQKELQEAVAKRKSAEATTEKLERLVGVLRKKINGVSLESSMPDEKQCLVRPLGSSLEKNPFIIANNRQGQKIECGTVQKSKISMTPPLKGVCFPQENLDSGNFGISENKENEGSGGSGGSGGGDSGNSLEGSVNSCFGVIPPTETASVTAQVTITGPVTDL